MKINMTNLNSSSLPQGIPLVSEYQNLLKTDLFLEMESFSNNFLKTHAKALKNYSWVADPFHQWSRQWEYPFAYSHIQQNIASNSEFIQRSSRIRILDAGSGCTFFPYYVRYKHANCRVYCCDYDSSLTPIFTDINNRIDVNVEFNVCDLANLSHKDNSFEIIYSISVLEHIYNREKIIKEFKRVLKPNGSLIITFDISLDNKTAIEISEAQDLLNRLNSEFRVTSINNFQEVPIDIQKPDILTTEFARTFDKKLLPWELTLRTFLLQLVRMKLPKRPFFNLAVYCGVWRKTK